MYFRQVYDEMLSQYAYLIGCQATGEAIVLDPQRDIDRYIALAERENLEITAVADTHIHADFLSGTREFAERGVTVFASDEGGEYWRFNWLIESSYTYQLIKDGDLFRIGNISFEAIHTPGHTPEHLCYLVTDRGSGADEPMGLASGDFVFVGDLGRPDLLESAAGQVGSMVPAAQQLFTSVQRFLKLNARIQVWPGHGAGSACGKALGAVPMSTVGYEQRYNASIQAALSGQDHFVQSILDGQPEPPMYFARMKHENRSGPAILGKLPRPPLIVSTELQPLTERTDTVILDTRLDRDAFMSGHLAGSIFAPLNRSFPTVAGSYVDEGKPIYLVIEEDELDTAVRNLVRIGLDDIAGYTTPHELARFAEQGGRLSSLEHIQMDDLSRLDPNSNITLLDVRGRREYYPAHIPGAMNIAHTRLLVRSDELSRDQTYAVYCRTGARAASASSYLAGAGYRVVYVDGDFDRWSTSNRTESSVAHT